MIYSTKCCNIVFFLVCIYNSIYFVPHICCAFVLDSYPKRRLWIIIIHTHNNFNLIWKNSNSFKFWVKKIEQRERRHLIFFYYIMWLYEIDRFNINLDKRGSALKMTVLICRCLKQISQPLTLNCDLILSRIFNFLFLFSFFCISRIVKEKQREIWERYVIFDNFYKMQENCVISKNPDNNVLDIIRWRIGKYLIILILN